MAKTNDFFAVEFYNNPSSLDEIVANGITPENTTIQDIDYYRNNADVQAKFKDESGKFNEQAFQDAYFNTLSDYNKFAQTDWESTLIKSLAKDKHDWMQPFNTNVKDGSAHVYQGTNPERRSMGLSGIGSIGDPSFSTREIAQGNYVRDENGNILDYTPDKLSLFEGGFLKSIFHDPLVLAQYDKDGYDDNGVFHQKGELKRDEWGDPYYEKLGTRSPTGKEVLRFSDVLTVDGSTLNKFDLFDADGIDKSIGRSILKTALTVAPLCIPYVGQIWGTIGFAAGLIGAAPELANMLYMGIPGTSEDDAIGKNLNYMRGWMGQFKQTSSDYAKEHTWAVENIGNIVSSSANQLWSQRQLANLTGLITKGGKELLSSEAGKNLSLAYLAVTSSTDTYDSFREAGVDETYAGLGALACTFGLYKLMQIDYFRDSFMKGTWFDESEAKSTIKKLSKEAAKEIKRFPGETAEELGLKAEKQAARYQRFLTRQKLPGATEGLKGTALEDAVKASDKWNWFRKTTNAFANGFWGTAEFGAKKLPTVTAILEKAANEGIEEMMEEVVPDAGKAILKGWEALGFNITDTGEKVDFGWSIEEAISRYLAAGVGGAIGGATFAGVDLANSAFKHEVHLKDKDTFRQIAYHILNGGYDDLIKWNNTYAEKGRYGSKNLSTTVKVGYGPDGKVRYEYQAGNVNDNHNKAVHDWVESEINRIKSFLLEEGSGFFTYQLGTTVDPKTGKPVLAVGQDADKNPIYNSEYVEALAKEKEAAESRGISVEEYRILNKTNPLTEAIASYGQHTSYMDRFTAALADLNAAIVANEEFITRESGMTITNDTVRRQAIAKIQEDDKLKKTYKANLDEIERLREIKNNLLYHKNDDVFANEALFVTQKVINEPILGDLKKKKADRQFTFSDSKEAFAQTYYNKDWNSLSEGEQKWIEGKYNRFKSDDNVIAQKREGADLLYNMVQLASDPLRQENELYKNSALNAVFSHSNILGISREFKLYNTTAASINEKRRELSDAEAQMEALKKTVSAEDLEDNDTYREIGEKIQALRMDIQELQNQLLAFEAKYGKDIDSRLMQESITDAGWTSKISPIFLHYDTINNLRRYLELKNNLAYAEGEVAEGQNIIINILSDLGFEPDDAEDIVKMMLVSTTFETINAKYPGFNEDMYHRILSLTEDADDVTWDNLQKAFNTANEARSELDAFLVENEIDTSTKAEFDENGSLQKITTREYKAILKEIKDYYQELAENHIILGEEDFLKDTLSGMAQEILPLINLDSITRLIKAQETDATDDDFDEDVLPQVAQEVYNKLNSIYQHLSTGNFGAFLSEANGFKNYINEALSSHGINAETTAKTLLEAPTNGIDFEKFLTELDNLKASTPKFSQSEFIRKMGLKVDDSVMSIIDFISQEQDRYIANPHKYLDSANSEQKLRDAEKLIYSSLGTLGYYINGYVGAINDFRKKAGKSQLFDDLSTNTLNALGEDSAHMLNKIKFLNETAKRNLNNKKGWQKRSAVAINKGILREILQKSEMNDGNTALDQLIDTYDNVEGGTKKGIKELYAEIVGVSADSFDEGNYAEINQKRIKFLHRLHEIAQRIPEDERVSVISNVLTDFLDKDCYLQNAGSLTDDADDITNYTVVNILAAAFALDSEEYYKQALAKHYPTNLAEIIEKGGVLPKADQEWVEYLSTALICNPAYFNAINTKVHEDLVAYANEMKATGEATGDTDLVADAEYLLHKTLLKNIGFIQGSLGSGKTSVVIPRSIDIATTLQIAQGILQENISVRYAAPHETQAETLNAKMRLEGDDKALTLDDLMTKLWDQKGDSPTFRPEEEGHTESLNPDTITLKDVGLLFKDSDKVRVLVFDEATNISEWQLQVISKYAETYGVTVVFAGDEKQIGAHYLNPELSNVSTGIVDCIYTQYPELAESVRMSNSAKERNHYSLDYILNQMRKWTIQNPAYRPSTVNDEFKRVRDTIGASSYYDLWYYYKPGKDFAGTRCIAETTSVEDIQKTIDELTKLSLEKNAKGDKKAKVAFITDDVAKWSPLLKNVAIVDANKAQGGEWDYVVLDKHYDFSGENASLYDAFKTFSTLEGRSRYGTIVLGNARDYETNFKVAFREGNESLSKASSTSLKGEELKKYIEWMLDGYKYLLEGTSRTEAALPSTEETTFTEESTSESGTETGGSEPSPSPEAPSGEGEEEVPPPAGPDPDTDVIKPGVEKVLTEDDFLNSAQLNTEVAEQLQAEGKTDDEVALSQSIADIQQEIFEQESRTTVTTQESFIDWSSKLDLKNAVGLNWAEGISDTICRKFICDFAIVAKYHRQFNANALKLPGQTSYNKLLDSVASQWNLYSDKSYYAVPDEDGSTSTIYWEFNYEGVACRIPIARISGKHEGRQIVKNGEFLFKIAKNGRSKLIYSDSWKNPINEALSSGTYMHRPMLFSMPANTTIKVGLDPETDPAHRKWFSFDGNDAFVNDNNGKTFLVWSDSADVTEEMLSKIFQYRWEGGHNSQQRIAYLDVKRATLQDHEIIYTLESGIDVHLINVHREITLKDLYDIVNIVKFAKSDGTWKNMSLENKKWVGSVTGNTNPSREDALRFLRNIFGEFAFKQATSLNAETQRKDSLENFNVLRNSLRLLSSSGLKYILNGIYGAALEIAINNNNKQVSNIMWETLEKRIRKSCRVKNVSGAYSSYENSAKTGYVQNFAGMSFTFGNTKVFTQWDPDAKKIKVFDASTKDTEKLLGTVEMTGISTSIKNLINPIIDILNGRGNSIGKLDSDSDLLSKLQTNEIIIEYSKKRKEITKGTGAVKINFYPPNEYDYLADLLNQLSYDDFKLIEANLAHNNMFKNGIYLNDYGRFGINPNLPVGTSEEDATEFTAWKLHNVDPGKLSASGWFTFRSRVAGVKHAEFEIKSTDFKLETKGSQQNSNLMQMKVADNVSGTWDGHIFRFDVDDDNSAVLTHGTKVIEDINGNKWTLTEDSRYMYYDADNHIVRISIDADDEVGLEFTDWEIVNLIPDAAAPGSEISDPLDKNREEFKNLLEEANSLGLDTTGIEYDETALLSEEDVTNKIDQLLEQINSHFNDGLEYAFIDGKLKSQNKEFNRDTLSQYMSEKGITLSWKDHTFVEGSDHITYFNNDFKVFFPEYSSSGLIINTVEFSSNSILDTLLGLEDETLDLIGNDLIRYKKGKINTLVSEETLNSIASENSEAWLELLSTLVDESAIKYC